MKAVVFDVDGTIVNTLSLYIEVYDLTYKRFGFNLTREEIIKNFPVKIADQCAKIGIPEKVEDFKRIYMTNIYNIFPKAKVFADFNELMLFLKNKQIKTAIVSFAFREYVDFIIKKLKLEGFFDTTVSFEDVKNPKPDSEAIYLVAKRLNVLPAEILVIGDAESDILMGKAAGSKTCLFYPKENQEIYPEEKIQNIQSDYRVESLKEIENFF